MTTTMMMKSLKRLPQLRHHALRVKTLDRVVAGDDVVVGGVGVVVVMKSKRQHHLVKRLMPPGTWWILTMTSARSCLRKIWKILSVCQLAVSRLSVASRMSHLRRRLGGRSRTTIPTMMTKWVKALNDCQRVTAVRTVRDGADAVAGGVVEDAKNPATPFVRKNARPPAHDVRRGMKTTSTMMTIWKLTMWI